jgi:WD40 repeat protein
MRPHHGYLALLLTLAPLVARADDGQLLAKLAGPSGTDVQFSRDGKFILAAGGNEARVWDAETFKPVTGPLKHGPGEKVVRAAFSSDGRRVLTAAGGKSRLWDRATGRELRVVTPEGGVRAAALSPKCALSTRLTYRRSLGSSRLRSSLTCRRSAI